jgi:uncharacterized protein (TIGR01777 family)
MIKTILITGATGLIGKHLVNSLSSLGYEIIVLTQSISHAQKQLPQIKKANLWNENLSISSSSEKIDAIINLAGTNLGKKRWTSQLKKEIYDSRIQTTKKIVDLIGKMRIKPNVLINTSGVDIYGDTGDKDIYEDSPVADNFIAKLVYDWESEALNAKIYGVRVVCLRTGFVISQDSKAFAKMIMPYKFFLGGSIGSGMQYLSWIDIEDLIGIYLFCMDNNVNGSVNATSPNPVRNKEFSKLVGRILHKPSLIRVPGFILKIIAGEAAGLILDGRKALPKKLLNEDYKFKYENLYDSLIKNLNKFS